MKKMQRKKSAKKKGRRKKWAPILSDKEAQDKIIELYLEGNTYPEMVSELHKSPNSIQKVIDSYKKSHVPPDDSKRSAALRLLAQKKNPLKVAIELDLSSEEVDEYNLELKKLNAMNDFDKLYNKVKDDLPDFITFYKSCRFNGITIDNFQRLEELAGESQKAESRLSALLRKEKYTQDSLDHKVRVLKKLEDQERNLRSSISKFSSELKLLEKEASDSYAILDSIKSQDRYRQIQEISQDEVRIMLDDTRELLEAAFGAIILVLGKYPDLQHLLYPPTGQLPDAYLRQVLEGSARPIFEEMKRRIQNTILERIHDELKRPIPGLAT
jgi:hypothetical protein